MQHMFRLKRLQLIIMFSNLISGRGLGTTIGAVTVSSTHGIRSGYLVFGILAGATSVAYLISYHLFLKKMELKRIHLKKTEEGNLLKPKLNRGLLSNLPLNLCVDQNKIGVDNPVKVTDVIQ